ncbi:hypothetical protein OIU76_013952 [Salix suchowensis]|nr:hypothetical protein OIU76_013952 [Salix suchowensis]
MAAASSSSASFFGRPAREENENRYSNVLQQPLPLLFQPLNLKRRGEINLEHQIQTQR